MTSTRIVGAADRRHFALSVVVEHLAGRTSALDMLRTRGNHGERACVLDPTELPGLVRLLRDAGEHDVAEELAFVLRHLPAALIGLRQVVVILDPATGWVLVAAISRSLPVVVVDLWVTRGPLDDAVMVTLPNEEVAPELTVRESVIYRDGELAEHHLTARS